MDLRSSNRLLAVILVLTILTSFDDVAGQGLYTPLEHKDPLIVPMPKPDTWRGISLAFKSYHWLRTNRVKPTDATTVDGKTLMLTFSRSWTFQRNMPSITYQLRRSVDRHEFSRFRTETGINNHWAQNLMRSMALDERDKAQGLIRITVPIKFPKLVRGLIGEGGASLQVNGSYRVSFEGTSRWDNRTQTATYKQSKFPSLDMEQISNFKIQGTIGSKIFVSVDQDSRRMTDLDNSIQIRYQGTDEDILQKLEGGNTSLPGGGSQFVKGGGGLFGIKVAAKLGNFDITAITSQEKGNTTKASYVAGSEAKARYLRDYDYKARTFFDLGINGPPEVVQAGFAHFTRDADPRISDEVVDLRLFVEEEDKPDNTVYRGTAYVLPDHPDTFTTENKTTTWREIDRNDYFYPEDQFYVEIFEYIGAAENLACWMAVRRANGSVDTIGDLSSSEWKLLLLKRDTPLASFVTFDYEWKNVYYLGGRDIDPEKLKIEIFKGEDGLEDQPTENSNTENGKRYIEILNLDLQDQRGNPNPDGKVDLSNQYGDIVYLDQGYLVFPSRRPFDSEALEEQVPEIYDEGNSQLIREKTKYFIAIESDQLREREQEEYELGHMNIIEGSEEVKLNGVRLEKDVDYRIYYDIGKIVFINPDLNTSADIDIDFEYQPLFSAKKKSLLGTRMDYVLSKDFKIGSTILFKTEKSTDRKPRVGQEESKYLVWDLDFFTGFDLPMITDFVDALPLIETDMPSRVMLSGEVAQSIPNPNTRGEAFIDDFEGSREAYSLSTFRRHWTKSSAPDPESPYYTDEEFNPRGRMIWYNPWQETPVTEIWNREVRERDNRTHILVLRFDPDSLAGEDSWAGVIRPLSRGGLDLRRTKFLELRLKPPSDANSYLRIHLGDISEDIDGDDTLDTEDFITEDNYLDELEDVGLDRWNDQQERENLGSDLDDPSGDNWGYDPDYPDNYENINGTEGNINEAGGFIPDTEDISGNKNLDVLNSYFEFTLDFSDTTFRVPGSELNGWWTYRLPLDSPTDSIGRPPLEKIQYARLLLNGFSKRDSIKIAAMDLVSNRWLVGPVVTTIDTTDDGDDPLTQSAEEEGDAKIEVAVINTEENSDYESPPGVAGEENEFTRLTEKEQSLLLIFTDFKPGDVGLVQKTNLDQNKDYAGYRRLQMFVHSNINDPDMMFMFRFGTDSLNYYEYRTTLHADTIHPEGSEGYERWLKANWVDVDLDRITQVKDSLKQLKLVDPEIDFLAVDPYAVRMTSKEPKVTNVSYFGLAVARSEDADGDPVSGELWLDELRVSDVRRDKGLAKRLSFDVSFGGVGRFNLEYRNEDPFFRGLNDADRNNLGSGTNKSSTRLSGSFNFDELLPPSWGANIPMSYNWSKRSSVPRLLSGSDIVLTEADREAETDVSYSESFSIKESFRRKTNSWLWNLTLNNFSSTFTANRSRGTRPREKRSEEGYTAHATYGISPGDKSIRALAWTSIIPFFPDAISQTAVGYVPSKVNVSGDVNSSRTWRWSEEQNSSAGSETRSYKRTFRGSMQASYKLFASLPTSFRFDTSRDLSDPNMVRLSFNPKKFMLGTELNRRQTFKADYSPKLLNFLSTSVGFSSSYTENSDPGLGNSAANRDVTNSGSMTFSGTFYLKRFFGIGQREKKDFIVFRPFLWVIRPVVKRVGDIKLGYTQKDDYRISALMDRPSLAFQFGLTKDPGVEQDESQADSRSFNDTRTQTYTAGTSIDFILGTKVGSNYSHGVTTSYTRKQLSKRTTFPDLSVTLGGLEKYGIFGWAFKSFSVNTSYSHKIDESINISGQNEDKLSETMSNNFSPLLGFSITWPKGISTRGRYELTVTDNLSYTGGSKSGNRSTTRSLTLSNTYKFNSPTGIKIPILGRIKFQSTLSLSLDISRRVNKKEQINADGSATAKGENTDLSISPRASYSFSSNIRGGMDMRWTDSNDKTAHRKQHVRQIGIWVEIKF